MTSHSGHSDSSSSRSEFEGSGLPGGPDLGSGSPSPRAESAPPGPTIESYIEAFCRPAAWSRWSTWPPDVFAISNLLLDHTETYRFAVAPPPDARWPPSPDWNGAVTTTADAWAVAAGSPDGAPPAWVGELWASLLRSRHTLLAELRRGSDPKLWRTLITLHAIADEACRGLASTRPLRSGGFEARAWERLAARGSLASVDATRVRITPKTLSPSRGITIRSLSRYLALTYESVRLEWHRIRGARGWGTGRTAVHLLLLPWPLQVPSDSFSPVVGPLGNMDAGRFGFFRFDPPSPVDLSKLESVVREAVARVGHVDAVVMPEAALSAREVGAVENVLSGLGVGSLVSGVRETAVDGRLGSNHAHVGVRTRDGWTRFAQAKHHRWCLDGPQIHQYHLSRRLDPARQWWEAIEIPERLVQVIDLGGGATIAPLICEDLARLDEVAELLRRIGPSLVVALLLDGPQLDARWPGRYAGVLADDPGAAVLTLTAAGMAIRSTPPGRRRSRVVACWSDAEAGRREITLARGSLGVLLTAGVRRRTTWTADGRRHEDSTPSIELSAEAQLIPRTFRSSKEVSTHDPAA